MGGKKKVTILLFRKSVLCRNLSEMRSLYRIVEKLVPELKTNTKDRFLLIDSIRGIASFWILCYHVLPEYFNNCDYLVAFWKFGRIGTDFFFVTSGFVSAIACNKILANWNGQKSESRFVIKRARKIYRVYFFSFLAAIAVIPTLMSLTSYLKSSQLNFIYPDLSPLEYLQYLSLARVFTSETWALSTAFVNVNGVYWFIATIIQIFIFIEIALTYQRRFKLIITTTFVLSLMCLIPGVKNIIPTGLFLPKFSEFYLGMALWYLIYYKHPFDSGKLRIAAIILSPLILLVLIFFHLSEMTGDTYRFFSAVFVAVALFAVYPLDKKLAGTKLGQISRMLGKFSYSTYLNHIIFWRFMFMVVSNFVPLPMTLAGPFILVPSILLCCFFFYAFFEYPSCLNGSLVSILRPVESVKNAYRSLK